jgi:arylsulfatase A-like enzyme
MQCKSSNPTVVGSNPISRRKLIRSLTAAASPMLRAAERPRRRPNLLFLFSDQHSNDMMGCSGNGQVQTPVMDRLSAEGVHFTHCFSSSPVCTPYRGMLLSGMHSLSNGAFVNDVTMIPGKGKYFGEALRDAGYRTGYFGKWHLLGGNRVRPIPAGELRHGFDGEFLSNNCTTMFDAARAYYWNQKGERTLYGDWEPYAQSRQACSFLDQQGSEQPFAMFVSWHPPHDHGKREQYYIYETLPELQRLYTDCDPHLRPAIAGLDASERRKKQYRDYMAQTTGVDRALGMVLDKLKDKGLDQDTIVVYPSDHGDCLGSYGWHSSAKDIPHDCSSHVPLLVRYPQALKPRRSDLMVGTLDLMPTLLGLMSIEPPRSCQGRNLAKAIKSSNDRASNSVPMMMIHNGPEEYRGVITRDWTFAAQRSDKPFHPLMNVLFNRKEDPYQMRNQFAENPKARRKMMDLTRSWMTQFQDPFVSHQELMASGIPWRFPDQGGAINRLSPLEWAKSRNAAPGKFYQE